MRTTEQKLLFSLVYQKTYPLQTLLGEVFGLSQSQANRWIHRLLPVLKQALDDLRLLPSRETGAVCPQERGHRGDRGIDYRRDRSASPASEKPGKTGPCTTAASKKHTVIRTWWWSRPRPNA